MWPGIHALNPINESEGGDSLVSRYGAGMFASIGKMYGPITSLPRENLLYPARIGEAPIAFTARPVLPYVYPSQDGPIHLEDTQNK